MEPRQYGSHFANDIVKCICLNENMCIQTQISLIFVFNGLVNDKASPVQIMALSQTGDN